MLLRQYMFYIELIVYVDNFIMKIIKFIMKYFVIFVALNLCMPSTLNIIIGY